VTVVLLHGLPLDARMWEPQLGVLGDQASAPTLYDFPGDTMDALADAVLESVAGKLVLVGASMGGYCALAAARQAPDRVAGVVLVGSRADPDPPERREGREAQLRAIAEGGATALWEAMAPSLFSPGVDPAVLERAHSLALEQPADGLARAVRAIRDRVDTRDVWARLADRSLAIFGELDPIAPPGEVEAPYKVVVAGAGHLVGMERPDDVTEHLRQVLDRWA
jgi:pimeloyl-ACP methyl ester carboxylesterase